jgi:hypothetical protein
MDGAGSVAKVRKEPAGRGIATHEPDQLSASDSGRCGGLDRLLERNFALQFGEPGLAVGRLVQIEGVNSFNECAGIEAVGSSELLEASEQVDDWLVRVGARLGHARTSCKTA